jgi:5-formyltetrahydrofolate cyclo-ligase
MSFSPKLIKTSAENARKQVLAKLKSLTADEREALSVEICTRAIKALESQGIQSISLYRPLRSEVNLSALENHFHKTGAKLCYPRVSEPAPHHESVDANSIDCIVIPGLAFGEHGERVGRGKGHYDQLLEGVNRPLRLVLAFDFQLFQALEQNAWDQPVHWIMTEKRELKLR